MSAGMTNLLVNVFFVAMNGARLVRVDLSIQMANA
jgi:hypothetical protein